MTTGGKGLHFVNPLAVNKRKPLFWAEAKGFAHDVSEETARDNPDLFLIKKKSLRGGRIFPDYASRRGRQINGTACMIAVLDQHGDAAIKLTRTGDRSFKIPKCKMIQS